MTLPSRLASRIRLPVMGAPMFIVSHPALVLAQCRAGVVGALPALSARTSEVFEQWLSEITKALAEPDDGRGAPSAPFAVNLIVHKTNARLEADLALCAKYKVPLLVTSLGARAEIFDEIHRFGALAFHDVISNAFGEKAIAKGADGLVAVAAGAGGHAGAISPFALLAELRRWFDGPLVLSGAIATGRAILAAQVLGADLAYVGSAFIATEEANASLAYKQMIVASSAEDVVYTPFFSGVPANYLKPSIRAAGLDPDALMGGDPSSMSFASGGAKVWRDVWGSGQGVGAVDRILPAAKLIARLEREYAQALGETRARTADLL